MAKFFSFLSPLKWLPQKAIWLSNSRLIFPKEQKHGKNLHLPFQVEIRQLSIICVGMAS